MNADERRFKTIGLAALIGGSICFFRALSAAA
jgi:hypothetical protein